jgi:hypothetical protein
MLRDLLLIAIGFLFGVCLIAIVYGLLAEQRERLLARPPRWSPPAPGAHAGAEATGPQRPMTGSPRRLTLLKGGGSR